MLKQQRVLFHGLAELIGFTKVFILQLYWINNRVWQRSHMKTIEQL